MTRMLVALVLVLATVAASPAVAADWHYCLAPSRNDPVVYMTGLFPTAAETAAIESGFTEALNGAGYSHDDVQCPRAETKASAAEMQQYAISFNLNSGNKVIRLRWAPKK